MGASLSLALPLVLHDTDMRMASRDMCDDETWTNTVLNRSSTSVQERLHALAAEAPALAPLSSPLSRRLAFAATDSVRLYVPDRREHDRDLYALYERQQDAVERALDEGGAGVMTTTNGATSPAAAGAAEEMVVEDEGGCRGADDSDDSSSDEDEIDAALACYERRRHEHSSLDHADAAVAVALAAVAQLPGRSLLRPSARCSQGAQQQQQQRQQRYSSALAWLGLDDHAVEEHDRYTCQGAFDFW